MSLPVHLLAQLRAAGADAPITDAPFFLFLSPWLVATLLKIVLIFTGYMVVVAMLTLAERKIAAWIQDRLGPNRVGPGGLLQPAADGLKNFMKEETMPAGVNRVLFVLGPIVSFVPALLTWAVIPFASPWASPWGLVEIQVADIPVGFLFTLAIASLGVYGIVLAGWASNNKYSLLGGLRSSAQMVSYEVSMGMSLIPVLLLAGNVTLNEIVRQQGAHRMWNVVTLTVSFLLFMISSFAETNRLPFDLPEAESELIAGYHTEYSSMKFSMFFIAEYANMLTASALMASLFFGGYNVPFTDWAVVAPFTFAKTVVTLLVMGAKMLFFVFLFMWIRWTVPRFRYDQLMSLGWKVMLPLALAYIVVVAGVSLALEAAGVSPAGALFGLVLLAINLVILVIMFVILDRGRIVSPAQGRLSAAEVATLRNAALRSARVSRTLQPEAGD